MKEHRSLFRVRKIRDQILRRHQRRPAGNLHIHAQFARNAQGERGFAQPGRAVEQNVPQRFAPLARRIQGDAQSLGHFLLANHVLDALRPQQPIVFILLGRRSALRRRLERSARARNFVRE